MFKETTNGDEPIFPMTVKTSMGVTHTFKGLTKREYFIACTFQGLLASDGVTFESAKKDAIKLCDQIMAMMNENNAE